MLSVGGGGAERSQMDSSELNQCRPPDIVISSYDDDDDDEVSGVEQVSSAFDHLVQQHTSHRPTTTTTTLDHVISDVNTLLRDVMAGASSRRVAVNRQLLAAECQQLVLDCRELVSSVFYCSTADVTVNADRALHSLCALVRHSHDVTGYDVSGGAPAELVSSVRHVVSAYKAFMTAASAAVGSATASQLELASFIREASSLARCLQQLINCVHQ